VVRLSRCASSPSPARAALGLLLLALVMIAALGCGQRAVKEALADPGPDSTSNETAGATDEPDEAEPTEASSAEDDQEPMKDDDEPDPLEDHPFPNRVPAPPFPPNVDWINTAGPIDLSELRGKFVLLDFWTYCCINCMHVLPELKKLEHAFPNELVVIGVHSAKFQTEEDTANIREAVLRYEIEHPVVNDANHVIWNRFGARSWPTLVVIDPEGKVVARDSGEVPFEALKAFFDAALPYYKKNGLLDETPLRFDLERYSAAATPLRFPGKVLADEAGDRLFIADSNHNRIVVTTLTGQLRHVIGSGAIGTRDGDYATAEFNKPQGMYLDGRTLYVADTENHLLRKIDLETQQVVTIAGTGTQGRGWPGLDMSNRGPLGRPALPERWVGPPMETALNSPWALWVHEETLYIAMAGPHQIWFMPLDESEIGIYAGNGREDIVDGPLVPKEPYEAGYSSFAQPSGLASDGDWLYVADSEGSSIRRVPFDQSREVDTLVGTAHLPSARLFTFGDVDGRGEEVRLQHALGVVVYEGKLYVADTYNNKIKVIDLDERISEALVGTGEPGSSDEPPQFDEPAGISAAAGKLYVADTNNHAIRVVDLAADAHVTTLDIKGLEPPQTNDDDAPTSDAFAEVDRVTLPKQTVKPDDGKLHLKFNIALPEGYKLNADAPMVYQVTAEGEQGPIDRSGIGQTKRIDSPDDIVTIDLALAEEPIGSATLDVGLGLYYCKQGSEAICKAATLAWRLPVEIAADAESDAVMIEATVTVE